jgi:hypothetical protein
VTRQIEFFYRVGNRWSFAVEFEASGERPRVWNEWWGSLWLWVGGQVVGRPFEIEMVMSGFDPLLESLYESGQKPENPTSSLLASMPADDALDLVMWSQYGDDEPPTPFAGEQSLLSAHEVLPRGSPFFDGWKAILIPAGSQERFIFCQEGGHAKEAKWPSGTFRSIVQISLTEFKRFAGEPEATNHIRIH